MELRSPLLFNPLGTDDVSLRTIINGNKTGLFNLNDVKYSWAKNLYSVMVGNFWVPEKVGGLSEDSSQFKSNDLTEDEKHAYKGILSFLIFLDSIQTMNLPHLNDTITAPEVNLILSIQAYQESIHSMSYATILESVVDANGRNEIYYFWKNDKHLLDRITFIGDIYQKFLETPSTENFFKATVANFLLESIYFYNGFAFFDTLVDQTKMLATGRMINYIRRDELTHITIFANIIRELKKEFPDVYNESIIKDMMSIAVEQEISWSKHILGDKIIGMSPQNIENYTKWLANKRLSMLGIDPLYETVTSSPYKHLERLEDNNGEKGNFFETTVTNYSLSSSLQGTWDF